MYINNETGAILPVEEIGRICKTKNIIFHCDAVQAFGKMKIDVDELNVDLLSFSAHKIYGPKGVGGLFIRDGVILQPLSFGGGQEANKRAGTENMAGIIGLGKALELINKNINEWDYIKGLQEKLESGLISKHSGCVVNAKAVKRSAYISNISFPGIDNQSMLLKMDLSAVSASVGSACSSGSIKQSHVLQAMDLQEDIINSAIRFSFGRFTTEKEIKDTLEIITSIINK